MIVASKTNIVTCLVTKLSKTKTYLDNGHTVDGAALDGLGGLVGDIVGADNNAHLLMILDVNIDAKHVFGTILMKMLC